MVARNAMPARYSLPIHDQEVHMAKGYWIARVDVSNPEKYQSYIAANAKPFKRFGARFLVRSGPH